MNGSKIVVALDNMEPDAAYELARKLSGNVWGFKVNDLLDGTHSPEKIVKTLGRYGRVFVDIKAHDIPHTVANRVKKYAKHGADLITVHASGGFDMMFAAVESFDEYKYAKGLGILAVTVLTSIDKETCDEIYHTTSPKMVARLADVAARAGVWGTVSSPNELALLNTLECMKGIRMVTPGVRSAGVAVHDQSRVDTPENAVRNGAELIVMGREVTLAKDPIAAVTPINALTMQAPSVV